MSREVFVSVDVETSGPIPGEYSLLSLGACLVERPEIGFYTELKPTSRLVVPKALEVSGFSIEELERTGEQPEVALGRLSAWLTSQAQNGEQPVFVGLNAGFDWSFVNYYFHRYVGNNPFGFTALDIKSLYMGRFGGTWSRTRSSQMHQRLGLENTANHNALEDARAQARLFKAILGASSS
jgi:DNA polymerase III epsilon subunit-like protein